MLDYKQILSSLLRSNNINVTSEQAKAFDQFLQAGENHTIIAKIVQHTDMLIKNWKRDQRVRKVMDEPLRIPNGTVGKTYDASFGSHPVLQEVDSFEWSGLEPVGLKYDAASQKITGVPTQSGEIRLHFLFKVKGHDEDSDFLEKEVNLTINPDPKSLWKNIESDRNDPYWKEDNVTVFAPLGLKNILVSSKRGRSHANAGSFREDDFAFENYDNGWSLIAVADGAGSAKASRKGSSLACRTLVEVFGEETTKVAMKAFDELLEQYARARSEQNAKQLNRVVYNNLGKAALTVHKKLDSFAVDHGIALKDLSTTLIFVLLKKYDFGYAILSFGVGDCPIALLNKDEMEITLMNWIDVGEYGGGTRFITMPEIFKSEDFASRFGFKLIDDFSYMFLMSDGIYDPKFVVESALDDVNKWKEFLADIQGDNPDQVKVALDMHNPEIEKQFSAWMDFWSPGNHDDRTLAIVF